MTVLNVKPIVRKRAPINDFDRIFNEFFNTGRPAASSNGNGLKTKPAVNVVENGGAFRIELAAPGLEKGDFTVNVDKNVLHIEVDKSFKAEEGETYKRREFGYYPFERSFQLPKTIDTEAIDANYENGILRINLPKKEEAKAKPARTIQIG